MYWLFGGGGGGGGGGGNYMSVYLSEKDDWDLGSIFNQRLDTSNSFLHETTTVVCLL